MSSSVLCLPRRPSEDDDVPLDATTHHKNLIACPVPDPIVPEEPEEPERNSVEMPGTPPIDARSRRAWGEVIHRRTEARRLVQQEEQQPLGRRAERHAAALVVQRLVRCFLSRTRLSTRLSAVGRPVELRVTAVTGLELLCDFRNVVSVFCNVRVLKKPFGPFMFHFSTSRCSNVNVPTWGDTFFVPMLSSKCDIVTTLIGVNNTGRLRFLGQAIVPMESGWEHKNKLSAPLAKWKFPVDESIVGLHRFVKGTVELAIKPISSRWPCKSGQFLQGPPIKARAKRLFPFWSKQVSSNGLMTSPTLLTPRKTPTSASPSRKVVVARWGVLTDTTFYLFDNTTAKLIVSLDLAKLQIIKSSAQPKSDSSPLFPLKLYFRGIVYVLYVSSYAHQQSWEYKINLHRRELLIP